MSTRAVIIRRNGDNVEYGQTKYDGMDNHDILSKFYNTPELVEPLFHKLIHGTGDGSGEGNGICALGKTIEETEWFGGSCYCESKPLDWFLEQNLYKWAMGYLDFAEYISVWNGNEWKTWEIGDIEGDYQQQKLKEQVVTIASFQKKTNILAESATYPLQIDGKVVVLKFTVYDSEGGMDYTISDGVKTSKRMRFCNIGNAYRYIGEEDCMPKIEKFLGTSLNVDATYRYILHFIRCLINQVEMKLGREGL